MPVPLHGQVAVSGTAQPLSATPVAANAFTIRAPYTNSAPVYIGSSAVTLGTGHQLDPGDAVDYQRTVQNGQVRYELSVSDFYVVGTSPDTISWFGSPS